MKCTDLKTLECKLTGTDRYSRLADLEPKVRAVASLWHRQGLGTMPECLKEAWKWGKEGGFRVEVPPEAVVGNSYGERWHYHWDAFHVVNDARFHIENRTYHGIDPILGPIIRALDRLTTVAEYRSRPVMLRIIRENPVVTRTIREEA